MSALRRLFGMGEPSDNLRIIITRHGERTDLALGKQWLHKMQESGVRDPRVPRLSPRAHFREWNYDPPLTVDGEAQSASVGQKLLHLGYPIDYCYSSPAYRAVQTANKILESQGRKAVPVNVEPGLFECPAWYKGKPLSFIPAEELAMDRKFNINPYYEPVYSAVDPTEDERIYYRRSRHLINEIIQRHKGLGGTVLLSGHGGSIEAVTRGLRGLRHRRGRPERLIQEALRVEYCNFAIVERDAHTRKWIVHLPESSNNVYEMALTMQNTIPLYAVSAQQQTQAQRPRPPRERHGGHAARPEHHHRHREHHHEHREQRPYR